MGEGNLFWGAMCEHATRTSYIRTNGSAIARPAEILSYAMPASLAVADVDEVSLSVEINNVAEDGTEGFALSLYDASAVHRIAIGESSTEASRFTVQNSAGLTASNRSAINESAKLAVSWDGSIVRPYQNGATLATFAKGGTLNLASGVVYIGSSGAGVGHLNGNIKNVKVFDKVLTGAEGEALTA